MKNMNNVDDWQVTGIGHTVSKEHFVFVFILKCCTTITLKMCVMYLGFLWMIIFNMKPTISKGSHSVHYHIEVHLRLNYKMND